MLNPSITIVTAFFDIGRGNWSIENGHPDYLQRTNETYLNYFSYLAKLENEMIVFTSKEFVADIEKIRDGKVTHIVEIDLDLKFKDKLQEIQKILGNSLYKQKIPQEQLKNPEYWSAKYVLITNLKVYFVSNAIKAGYVNNRLIAWVDFGYCRDKETLLGISNWYYPFDEDYIHCFTLRPSKILGIKNPKFPRSEKDVLSAITNNKVYIIGGVTISSKKTWLEFNNIYDTCKNNLIAKNILDDDQGIYLMCYVTKPNMIKLHYLGKTKQGKRNWFGVMQKFHIK